MKTAFVLAALLGVSVALPALAQSEPSDRYRRDQSQTAPTWNDQQAQNPSKERTGELENLRDKGMTSPNVRGEGVQENPNTGVPEPQRTEPPTPSDRGIRP